MRARSAVDVDTVLLVLRSIHTLNSSNDKIDYRISLQLNRSGKIAENCIPFKYHCEVECAVSKSLIFIASCAFQAPYSPIYSKPSAIDGAELDPNKPNKNGFGQKADWLDLVADVCIILHVRLNG